MAFGAYNGDGLLGRFAKGMVEVADHLVNIDPLLLSFSHGRCLPCLPLKGSTAPGTEMVHLFRIQGYIVKVNCCAYAAV